MVYAMAWQGMSWYVERHSNGLAIVLWYGLAGMVWPGGQGMVYGMAW